MAVDERTEPPKQLEIGICLWGMKNRKLCVLSNGTFCNDVGWPMHKYTKFLPHDSVLAQYILCYGSSFVHPSIWVYAEGPRDAKSCRGICVVTSSSTRPIATDAQQWHGLSIHAAYCYRHAAVVRPVHVAYCYCGYGGTTGWQTYRLCLAFLPIIIIIFLISLTPVLNSQGIKQCCIIIRTYVGVLRVTKPASSKFLVISCWNHVCCLN